jgi:hypothetical protein
VSRARNFPARDVLFHRAVVHRAATSADRDCPLTKGHLLSRNAQRLPPWKVPAQDRADQKNFGVALFGDSRHRWMIAGKGSTGTWLSRLATKKVAELEHGRS